MCRAVGGDVTQLHNEVRIWIARLMGGDRIAPHQRGNRGTARWARCKDLPDRRAVQPGACKAIASPDTGVAAGTPAAYMNEPSTSPTASCRRLKIALAPRLLVGAVQYPARCGYFGFPSRCASARLRPTTSRKRSRSLPLRCGGFIDG